MVDYEVILRGLLITAYTLMCVASLVIRSRLSGSLVAKRFSALAIASAIGMSAITLELLRKDLGFLRTWHPPALVEHVISLLGIPIPLVIMAIVFVSLAHLYSRFAR